MKLQKADPDIDTQSLSGTTIAASTYSAETILPPATRPASEATNLEYRFYKGNGLSSKASLRSSSGAEYRLTADIHQSRPSTMQLFDSRVKKSLPLGVLEFSHTHNNFQVRIGLPSGEHLLQVRARVGHPHPTSYSFTLPAPPTSSPQSVIWTKLPSGTGYELTETGTNTLLAIWRLVPNQRHQAVLRWHVLPRDQALETLVLLSFVGALARLKLKGRTYTEKGSGLARWNGMWFMAILGTAAVA